MEAQATRKTKRNTASQVHSFTDSAGMRNAVESFLNKANSQDKGGFRSVYFSRYINGQDRRKAAQYDDNLDGAVNVIDKRFKEVKSRINYDKQSIQAVYERKIKEGTVWDAIKKIFPWVGSFAAYEKITSTEIWGNFSHWAQQFTGAAPSTVRAAITGALAATLIGVSLWINYASSRRAERLGKKRDRKLDALDKVELAIKDIQINLADLVRSSLVKEYFKDSPDKTSNKEVYADNERIAAQLFIEDAKLKYGFELRNPFIDIGNLEVPKPEKLGRFKSLGRSLKTAFSGMGKAFSEFFHSFGKQHGAPAPSQ